MLVGQDSTCLQPIVFVLGPKYANYYEVSLCLLEQFFVRSTPSSSSGVCSAETAHQGLLEQSLPDFPHHARAVYRFLFDK